MLKLTIRFPNSIVVILYFIIGETGCGKSSQLVQYIVDDIYDSEERMVVCSQPRAFAAESLADRVQFEFTGGRRYKSNAFCFAT